MPLFRSLQPRLVATQDDSAALRAKERWPPVSKEIRAGSESLLEATRRRLSL
jgi:hypothetical protein